MNDEEMAQAIRGLKLSSRWERLEVRTGNGGYCMTADETNACTAEVLADPSAWPPGAAALAELLARSGWQRLEIMMPPWSDTIGGWCERPDGSGVLIEVRYG